MSRDIFLTQIDPDPNQPRKHFDPVAIDELAASIQANGLAVPILLRPVAGRFVIVHGERRYRAAGLLGWETIPAEVKEIDPDQAQWLALIENIQRADLSPIEEAQAYQARLAAGLTQQQLADRIGKTQSYIAQKLRLLRLPESIQLYLNRRLMTEGHARQLMRFNNFYDGLLADFEPERAEARLSEKLPETAAWEILAFPFLRDIRPEDNPPCWFFLLGPSRDLFGQGAPPAVAAPQEGADYTAAWRDFVKRAEAIAAGCRLADKSIAESGGALPRWELTAFWWGSYAVYRDLSVNRLAKQIDLYIERLYSAVAYAMIKRDMPNFNPQKIQDEIGKANSPRRKRQLEYTFHSQRLDDLFWWGCRSDVHHAGFDLDNLPDKVSWQALTGMGEEAYYVAPSSCQPFGLRNKEFLESQRFVREYQDNQDIQ